MIIFEEMVEFDLFCKNLKFCFSPIKFPLHDSRRVETLRDRRYKEENLLIQQDKLSLLGRNHGVALDEETHNKLENEIGFCFNQIFFVFLHI